MITPTFVKTTPEMDRSEAPIRFLKIVRESIVDILETIEGYEKVDELEAARWQNVARSLGATIASRVSRKYGFRIDELDVSIFDRDGYLRPLDLAELIRVIGENERMVEQEELAELAKERN